MQTSLLPFIGRSWDNFIDWVWSGEKRSPASQILLIKVSCSPGRRPSHRRGGRAAHSLALLSVSHQQSSPAYGSQGPRGIWSGDTVVPLCSQRWCGWGIGREVVVGGTMSGIVELSSTFLRWSPTHLPRLRSDDLFPIENFWGPRGPKASSK